MNQKWKVAGLMAFFLGFPLAGMMVVWGDAHGKIRASATTFVAPFADSAFGKWDGSGVLDAWNAQTKEAAPDQAAWAKWKATYGEAVGPVRLEPFSSYTSERQDQMWQVVKMRLHVPGSLKAAVVEVEVARKTVVPIWHFEHIEVRDDKP